MNEPLWDLLFSCLRLLLVHTTSDYLFRKINYKVAPDPLQEGRSRRSVMMWLCHGASSLSLCCLGTWKTIIVLHLRYGSKSRSSVLNILDGQRHFVAVQYSCTSQNLRIKNIYYSCITLVTNFSKSTTAGGKAHKATGQNISPSLQNTQHIHAPLRSSTDLPGLVYLFVQLSFPEYIGKFPYP